MLYYQILQWISTPRDRWRATLQVTSRCSCRRIRLRWLMCAGKVRDWWRASSPRGRPRWRLWMRRRGGIAHGGRICAWRTTLLTSVAWRDRLLTYDRRRRSHGGGYQWVGVRGRGRCSRSYLAKCGHGTEIRAVLIVYDDDWWVALDDPLKNNHRMGLSKR
jgi:hypothetical protein